MMAATCKMWHFLGLVLMFSVAVSGKQKSSPLVLREETWSDMLEGEWLVKFYAPWCPACKALSPVWDSVSSWSDDLGIKVAKVDVTENPGLSGRFLVTSLPTVYHVKDGVFRIYRGPRTEDEFVSFVDDKKWQEADPVPWYSSPTSIHMSALGMFFKVSMMIRDLHDTITTEYGIPVWGSYIMFAVATIVLGLLLGLFIVFLCDIILPSHPPEQSYINARQSSSSGFRPRPKPSGSDDDKDSDILIDDLPPKSSKDEGEDEDAEEKEENSQDESAEPNEEDDQAGSQTEQDKDDTEDQQKKSLRKRKVQKD